MRWFLLFLLAVSFSFPVLAGNQASAYRSTDLPLPRFVSLKADKVYVRAGPAFRYPLKWIYKRESLPLEIIQEFDAWRKIRDFEGGEGWVHQSLLSGSRTVIVLAEDPVAMRQAPGDLSRMIAKLEPYVIAAPGGCEMDWCRIEVDGFKGWVKRKFLWGIYEHEDLN